MSVSRKYLVAVALLAVLAIVFGVVGTAAPPLAESDSVSHQQSLPSDSVGHFQNPPSYDSGWVDITTKAGQYVTLRHGLNTSEVVVDITGKQSLDPNSGALAWSRTYGGTGNDYGYSVVQTGDGGYALAGYTYSYGAGFNDFWLVKTDGSGNMLWNKTYGGASYDYARSVVQTGDGGYALAGFTYSYGAGSYDFWLVKTDLSGNMLWNRTYGGAGGDFAYSVVQTGDGGYAIAGDTLSYGAGLRDFWLVKTDGSGNMLWNKTYGGTSYDYAISVVQTGDGGYALGGYTSSYGAGGYDFWLVKTDLSGNMLWNRTYGGTWEDVAYSVVQTGDGGYALAGYTYSDGAAGSYDFLLVRISVEMNLEHQRNLGSELGLVMTGLTNTTITLYRGPTDPYWNYVRVRIWLIREPTWIYGDLNMDGIVDAKDLYIVSRNYGKTLSLLSLSGIITIASIHTIKKRKQPKQPNYIS